MSVLEDKTPADFKEYFVRDFKYLPEYDDMQVYFENDIVYYEGNFYKLLLDSVVGVDPLPATDPLTWEAVPVDLERYVLDQDITKAFAQALAFINPRIFEKEAIMVDAFLYCTAHFLVQDIRMAESGLDSRGEGIMNSKSVGSVSVSYSLPEAYTSDPLWGQFALTGYGQKYLTYVIPRVAFRTGIALGRTLP